MAGDTIFGHSGIEAIRYLRDELFLLWLGVQIEAEQSLVGALASHADSAISPLQKRRSRVDIAPLDAIEILARNDGQNDWLKRLIPAGRVEAIPHNGEADVLDLGADREGLLGRRKCVTGESLKV